MLASRLVSECVTLVFVSEFKLAHLIKKNSEYGREIWPKIVIMVYILKFAITI